MRATRRARGLPRACCRNSGRRRWCWRTRRGGSRSWSPRTCSGCRARRRNGSPPRPVNVTVSPASDCCSTLRTHGGPVVGTTRVTYQGAQVLDGDPRLHPRTGGADRRLRGPGAARAATGSAGVRARPGVLRRESATGAEPGRTGRPRRSGAAAWRTKGNGCARSSSATRVTTRPLARRARFHGDYAGFAQAWMEQEHRRDGVLRRRLRRGREPEAAGISGGWRGSTARAWGRRAAAVLRAPAQGGARPAALRWRRPPWPSLPHPLGTSGRRGSLTGTSTSAPTPASCSRRWAGGSAPESHRLRSRSGASARTWP